MGGNQQPGAGDIRDGQLPGGLQRAKDIDKKENSFYNRYIEVDETGRVRLAIGPGIQRVLFKIHAQTRTPVFRVKTGPPGFEYGEGIVTGEGNKNQGLIDVTIPGAHVEIVDGKLIVTIPITE